MKKKQEIMTRISDLTASIDATVTELTTILCKGHAKHMGSDDVKILNERIERLVHKKTELEWVLS